MKKYSCSKTIFVAAMIFSTLASVRAQSLWREDSFRPMYADKRAASVGDILTVIVQESTTASKDNKSTTTKKSDVTAGISSFFTPGATALISQGGQTPSLGFTSKSDASGEGSVGNSEQIVARVAVRVIDVLPNRNLVIEGKRDTAFSGEKQSVVLHGVVRPEDIAADDTIYSYNIADGNIQIVSSGVVSDAQRKGWFHRAWDKLSPF